VGKRFSGGLKKRFSRPSEIRIEGKVVRSTDLVAEYGKNTPVVFLFDAQGQNGNGMIKMGVHSDALLVLSGMRDYSNYLKGLIEKNEARLDIAIENEKQQENENE